MNRKKEEWVMIHGRRRRALMNLAKHLGEGHPVTKIMGSHAWGRSECEPGPCASVHDWVRAAGYLEGVCRIIQSVANEHFPASQRVQITNILFNTP